MHKVLVLLSTYNGEKYLEEQLDSLYNQKEVDVEILVRDDGSTDKTLDILENYARKKGKISIIKGKNIGWKMSFMELVKACPKSEYYAFCDQDDVWLPEKLSVAVGKLQEMPRGGNLYFSNLKAYRNGTVEGDVKKGNLYFDKYRCMINCQAYGCTMVFNDALMSLVKSSLPNIECPHDFWFYQVGVLTGNVFYDDNSYILYRLHEKNQIGAKLNKKSLWQRRLTTLKTKSHDNERETYAKSLLQCYGDKMDKGTIEIVSAVADYRNNFKAFFSLLFSRKYIVGSFINDLILKMRILLKRL